MPTILSSFVSLFSLVTTTSTEAATLSDAKLSYLDKETLSRSSTSSSSSFTGYENSMKLFSTPTLTLTAATATSSGATSSKYRFSPARVVQKHLDQCSSYSDRLKPILALFTAGKCLTQTQVLEVLTPLVQSLYQELLTHPLEHQHSLVIWLLEKVIAQISPPVSLDVTAATTLTFTLLQYLTHVNQTFEKITKLPWYPSRTRLELLFQLRKDLLRLQELMLRPCVGEAYKCRELEITKQDQRWLFLRREEREPIFDALTQADQWIRKDRWITAEEIIDDAIDLLEIGIREERSLNTTSSTS